MLGHAKIKQGLQFSNESAPAQSLEYEDFHATTAALLGVDYPRLRPSLKVAQGDLVSEGDIVFTDRKNPDIAFAAPMSGRVTSIDFGPRRSLSALVITAVQDTKSTESDGLSQSDPIDASDENSVRKALLARGCWPAFQTRPFGGIPKPNAVPEAIFVNATRASPRAPAPWVVLERMKADFQMGVDLLTLLTDGSVFVCQAPEDSICTFSERVTGAFFSGTRASGLSGTHIDRLHPVSLDHHVWTIGYQDVAAIGHLFHTGQYMSDRIISISGPGAVEPKLIKTCIGANIGEICNGQVAAGNSHQRARILSGDMLTGREAAFIGRYHLQVSISNQRSVNPYWQWLYRPSAAQDALIPTAALEQALAIDVVPVPLMRALSIGDSAAAEQLGCLALVEEDVAALTELCTSGADYGVLLRQVLDDLAGNAV